MQAAKNPDVAKAIQNAAKLRKAKERLELSNSNMNNKKDNSSNQPLDFSMEGLGKTKIIRDDFPECIPDQGDNEQGDGRIKSEENVKHEKEDIIEEKYIENDTVNDEIDSFNDNYNEEIDDKQIKDTIRPNSQTSEHAEDINDVKTEEDITSDINDSVKTTDYKQQYQDNGIIS